MKSKKLLSSILCIILALTMSISPSVTALASGTGDGSEISRNPVPETTPNTGQPAENDWIQTSDVYGDIYGRSDVLSSTANSILTDVYYEDGTMKVFLHPYLEEVFDENNHPDAKGTVVVNLYQDSEENWIANETGEAYSGLVTAAFVSGIELDDADKELSVPVENIPQTFFAEAVFTLTEGSKTIFTERVTSCLYTEAIAELRSLKISDLLNSNGEMAYGSEYIENLSPEEGEESSDFIVYRTDGVMINDEDLETPESHVITRSTDPNDPENTFILSGVPQKILDMYSNNEALKRVSQLVFVGKAVLSDDKNTLTIQTDETPENNVYTPMPIVCSGYRAKAGVAEPQSFTDYEYRYAIEYVYGNGAENAPTGIKFVINKDAQLSDLYECVSYQGSDAGAVVPDSPLLTSGSSDLENALNGMFSKDVTAGGYSARIDVTPGFDIDFEFSIKHIRIAIKLSITLDSEYTVQSIDDSPSGINGYEIKFSTYGPGIPFAGSVKIGTGFNLENVQGKGKVRGGYHGYLSLSIGTNGINFQNGFDVKIFEFLPGSSDNPLVCATTMNMNLDLNCLEVDLFFFKIGPILQGTIDLGWGSADSGIKDTEKKEDVIHLCNESENAGGCAKGTMTKYYNGHLRLTIRFFKKWSWDFELYKKREDPKDFYYSAHFHEFGYGECPHKVKKEDLTITANPEPGVYEYNPNGLDVALSVKAQDAKIYYAVIDPNSEGGEDPSYSRYTSPIHLDFIPENSIDSRYIEAYVVYSGVACEPVEFTYMMLGEGIDCLLIPNSMNLPVGGDETAIFIYPSASAAERAIWSGVPGTGEITYSELSTYRMPGVEAVQVTGTKEGAATLKAEFNGKSATCKVTVNDSITAPTAAFGTNLYLLREISTAGMGQYKDQDRETEETAPYYYHDGKHTVGEVLSHSSWTGTGFQSSTAVKIFYTVDGSEPTIQSTEYKRGDKVYLSVSTGDEFSVVTLKAIAYDPVSGKVSDTSSWTYIIVDSLPSAGDAILLMIPQTKHLQRFGLGLCLAVYIPSLLDLVNPSNWISISPKWQEEGKDPIPCFKVSWSWRSDGWLTVPVIGTNEWITEPLLGVDFVQVGLVFGLRETGRDKYVSITATGKAKSYPINPGAKKTGTCKVYVYDDEEPERQEYTIYYDTNGGTGSFSNQTKKRGETISLHSGSPKRTGYTFKGWALKNDATEADYQPGDSFRRDENATLYAVWKKNPGTFVIKYDANGGTDAPATQEKQAGKDLTLRTEIPTLAGYLFLGWSENRDDVSVEYKAGGTFSKDKDVTLYAKWRKDTSGYIVTYDANGGTGAPASQVKQKGVDLQLSETIPTKAAQKFEGWSSKPNPKSSDVEYPAGGDYDKDEDVTLYAVWTYDVTKYRIVYDANGGTGAPPEEEHLKEMGGSVKISSQIPTRAGYTFKIWNRDGTEENFAPGADYSAQKSLFLKAVWEKKTDVYVVSYNANGGTGAPAEQEKEKGVSLTLTSETPTRYGYTFKGWSKGKDSLTADYAPGASYTEDKSVILYAVWEAATDTCFITYDANGGKDAPEEQLKKKGTDIYLSTKIPEKTGYTFLGWSTDKYAETSEYAPADLYQGDEDLNLYAVWERDYEVYLIEYNANGGTWAPDSQIKLQDIDLKLSSKIAQWDGGYRHEFMGWATTPDAKEAQYDRNDYFAENKDTVLYAVWKVRTDIVCVIYHAMGGVGAPEPQSVSKGQEMILSETIPTRTGYIFKGWADTEEKAKAGTVTHQPKDQFRMEDNLDLYAVWEQIEGIVELTYDANGGENAPESQQVTTGGSTRISRQKPSREGYRFLGWADEETAAAKTYSAGDTITLSANKTIYAVWIKEWTVTVKNGKTAAGKTTEKFIAGDKVNVIANTPAAGRQFAIWNVLESSLELTDDQKTAANMKFDMPAEDVTLKAVETFIPITPHSIKVIRGTANGETETNFFGGTSLKVVAATANGSVFDHWEAQGITLTNIQKISPVFKTVMPDADVVLTAVYTEEPPEKTYDLLVINGTIGDGSETQTEGTFKEGTVLMATADKVPEEKKKTQYFEKWLVVEGNLELTEEQIRSETITFEMPAEDVVLMAIYHDEEPGYDLLVVYGTITDGTFKGKTEGRFDAGDVVKVAANKYENQVFDHWEPMGIKLTETEKKSKKLTITMPDNFVILVAKFNTVVPGTNDTRPLIEWMSLATGCVLLLIGGLYMAFKRKDRD